MLRKEASNKILKVVKTVAFASTISLLNPIATEAKTNNEPVMVTTNDSNEQTKTIVASTLSIGSLITLIGIGIYTIKLHKKENEYFTALENDNISNEEEATKHIKIICK